jgi:hypothetical protein
MRTLRFLRLLVSYTLMMPFSARSATASSFLLGDMARAVIASASGPAGMKRWLLPSAACTTTQ